MKKLLITTAMCLVFTSGIHGIANANEVNTSIIYENASAEISTLAIAPDLFRGDFQKLALTSTPGGMYSGWGARTMVSVAMERY